MDMGWERMMVAISKVIHCMLIPILLKRKLILREVKELGAGHTAVIYWAELSFKSRSRWW